MARDFPNTTTEWLLCGASFIDATDPRPISLACWYNADANDIDRHWILTNNYAAGNPRLGIVIAQHDGTTYKQGLYSNAYQHGNTFTLATGEWHHYGWSWAADNQIAYYRDGAAMGTDSMAPAGTTGSSQAALATLNGSIADFSLDGKLAEFAVWNAILTLADFASLAAGCCPVMVRPGDLTNYLPLGGIYDADDGDHDIVGGNHATEQGTIGTTDHPGGLIYPSQAIVVPAAPTPAGITVNRTIQVQLSA